jgi:hydroxyacylglutathione hydrolase
MNETTFWAMKSRFWTTETGHAVHRILGGRSNVYLVSYGNKRMLVDTGRRAGQKDLVEALAAQGVESLDAVILTHTHFDHAENAAFLQRQYGAQIVVHKTEAEYLKRGESPLPAGTFFFTEAIVRLASVVTRAAPGYDPCRPDVVIDDTCDLVIPGCHLLSTPGHSPGSMSVVVGGEIALVGDAMFGVFPHSIFPPFADDIQLMVSSWGVLFGTGCQLFLPGHGSANHRQLVAKAYARHRSTS